MLATTAKTRTNENNGIVNTSSEGNGTYTADDDDDIDDYFTGDEKDDDGRDDDNDDDDVDVDEEQIDKHRAHIQPSPASKEKCFARD
jgi:hypothetical protein